MKNNKKVENIFIKAPIIMSIITYLSLIIGEYISIFKFEISFLDLLDLFIAHNISYCIICVGILIYFINVNNHEKKDLSINILISSFILPMVSSFTWFVYKLINSGFHTDYLLDICFGVGLLINVIYLNNIFNSKKISNKLLIASTILILIQILVNVNIYNIIKALFTISYVPYFYNLYEKIKDKKKFKIYLDSQIGLKVIYSIIMIISFVLLFIPAYGHDLGYGHSSYDNYFNSSLNINIVVVLISLLIFIWTNNKKMGFCVSILYPIEMILFTIIYCSSGKYHCINFVGIINIVLSVLSVLPYFIFSRTEDEKYIEKEEFKMKDENIIYEIDGNMGKILKVYEDRCVISTKAGIKSFVFFGGLMGATLGDKEFYYSDVTSIQFKNIEITTGYLQFEYAGSHSGNNFTSENSFPFSATIGTEKYNDLKEAMPPIYEYILGKVREHKNQKNGTVVQQISSADELAKFKKLLDDGVISQEEFNAKKKQLLGL